MEYTIDLTPIDCKIMQPDFKIGLFAKNYTSLSSQFTNLLVDIGKFQFMDDILSNVECSLNKVCAQFNNGSQIVGMTTDTKLKGFRIDYAYIENTIDEKYKQLIILPLLKNNNNFEIF